MADIIKTQQEVTENRGPEFKQQPEKPANTNLISRKRLIQYILQMEDVLLPPKALNRILDVINNFPAGEDDIFL